MAKSCSNFAVAFAILAFAQQPAGAQKQTAVSADGVGIVYETHGKGTPALVFVHGWSCDRSYWKDQLRPFSEEFTAVAVDLAGHGDSGVDRRSWTIPAFGADVAAVVDKLRLPKVILIGHSMGGDVIVDAARLLPGRVAGMIWVDVYKSLGTQRTPEQIKAFVAPFRENFAEKTRTFVRGMFPLTADRSLVDRVALDMSAAPPSIALQAMESSISNDRVVPGALRQLKLPVIAINPESPETDVASMKRHGIEVMLIPGVGHFPMMEEPVRFNRTLRIAIQRIGR